MADLHLRAGALADGTDPVLLTPERAGWARSGLRVLRLADGEERTITIHDDEAVVLPLTITGLVVDVDGERFEVAGRASVFERVTDFVYVGRDSTVTLRADRGGEVALTTARCGRRLPARYGTAEAVPIEIRGAGACTRQVNNFLSPDTWPDADRLMAVELLTPGGNWSSYPPHRHDASPECPVNNEEIYYFEVAPHGATPGFGVHRLYTDDGEIDETVEVHDGDVFLIPRGYHGPCIAAPGHTLYYLNVLAGPDGARSMAFCDDPAHHWVRDSWEGMDPDPRCPMTSPTGPVGDRFVL